MSRVSYNNAKLIPAPLVSINQTFQTTGDGQKIGSNYQITLHGTLVADMGSPDSKGVFWTTGGYPPDEVIHSDSRLSSILNKQEALRKLFSIDGLALEIQSADGSPPLKCYPRVVSKDDTEGIWFDLENYTITFEADRLFLGSDLIYDGFDDLISAAEDSWSIDQDENGSNEFPTVFRVSRTISSTGKRGWTDNGLEKEAWEQAKSWVEKRLGFQNFIYNGTHQIPTDRIPYNYMRNEQIGVLSGTYAITETWALSSLPYIETLDISITKESNSSTTNVQINGTVTGLDERDANFQITKTKLENAEEGWIVVQTKILPRANSYSNLNLNIIPLSSTVGKSINNGVITYNYSYDTRPSNVLTGSLSESVSLIDDRNVDIFSVIPIPFKTNGPVIQNIYTKKEKTRELEIEIVFDYPVGTDYATRFLTNHPENRSPQKEEIIAMVQSLAPSASFIDRNTCTWDGTNRYTKSVTWVY